MWGCFENPFANDTSLDPRPLPSLHMRRRYSALSSGQIPFSSPEPVVSWSRGRGRLQIKPSGSGDENGRYRMSENFWHAVAHVQKLQISLLMLITDFCPSPLHWGKNFTSWALSREWLLWDVLKMHHFTQLGFTDNLEKTVTETGWTHCRGTQREYSSQPLKLSIVKLILVFKQ